MRGSEKLASRENKCAQNRKMSVNSAENVPLGPPDYCTHFISLTKAVDSTASDLGPGHFPRLGTFILFGDQLLALHCHLPVF